MTHICPTCKEHLSHQHSCSPDWEVCFGESLVEAIDYGVIHVHSADMLSAVELAAASFDKKYESSIERGDDTTAWARVTSTEHTPWTKLNISCMLLPIYSASLTTYTETIST